MRTTLRHLIFSLLLGFVVPHVVCAAQASLTVGPKDGTYVVGNEFTVGVVLDTGGASVNAVEGKLKYLPDDLAVVRVTTSGSPVTSWTLTPDTAGEKGLIAFGGVNPAGIQGKGKTLFSVTFRVVRSGEARVRLASGAAILAEGGAGTNILTDLRGGTYTLVSSADRIEALHGGPSLLRSTSHPDQAAWYQSPDVSFEWSHAPTTDQVRFSVDQNPEGAPTATLEGSLDGKNVPLSAGVWYGHLALHDDSGWSPVGHLRVQIDTDRPNVFRINEVPRTSTDEPRATLALEASDEQSGISHYEISVAGGAPIRWEDDGNHRYQLEPLPPGDHVISVRVFDRAGNSLSETIVVHIEGLAVPVIEQIPSTVSVGGEIDVEGTVSGGTTARVSVGFDGGESRTEDIAAGPGGKFIHTFVFPQAGLYRIKVQSIDQRSATSLWTPEVLVRVEPRSLLGAIGSVGGGGGILLSLVFLAAGVLVGMWYGRSLGGVNAPRLAPLRVVADRVDEENGFIARRERNISGVLIGFAGGITQRTRGVLSRMTSIRKRNVPPVSAITEAEDFAPAPAPVSLSQSHTVPTIRSESSHTTLSPAHTLSLKRKAPDAPPHSPTVLGR